MKRIIILSKILLFGLIGLFILTSSINAQNHQIDKKSLKKLRFFEDSLASLALSFSLDSLEGSRREALHKFIPYLVNSLKTPNSYYFPFDSVRGISIVESPDSSFRIFSWQFRFDDGTYHHYGAIQRKSSSFDLIPLFDGSDTMQMHSNRILSNKQWFGAVYYKILHHEFEGKDFYTLFGFDANDLWSKKKFFEILTFENNQPVFGKPNISVTDSLGNTTIYNRFFLEYKHDTKVGLNYDRDLEMIIFDHLVPYDDKYDGLYFTYIPDGTYEGFKFENGKWIWIEKIFHFAINENDNPPMPAPVLNNRD